MYVYMTCILWEYGILLMVSEIRRSPVEVESLSRYTQGLGYIPGGDRRISSITFCGAAPSVGPQKIARNQRRATLKLQVWLCVCRETNMDPDVYRGLWLHPKDTFGVRFDSKINLVPWVWVQS